MHKIAARAAKLALVSCLAAQGVSAAAAQGTNVPLVRDAEIESLMRIYTKPIFKVAGINEGAAKVYLVRQQGINAFVAGGQRIFINTGLLSQAKTPNEVIGVLAQETGLIAGGHLARGEEALIPPPLTSGIQPPVAAAPRSRRSAAAQSAT
jgi:predicted Zn-dependent protease